MTNSINNDSQDLWEIILTEMSKRIPRASFDTWIAPLNGEIVVGNTIIIGTASEFAEGWVKERYEHHFIDVLKELTGQEFNVQVTGVETKVVKKTIDSNTSFEKESKHNNEVKYKKVSVKVPIMTPSSSSIKLRRDNARIIASIPEYSKRFKFPFS